MAGTQYTGNAIPAPGNVEGPRTGEDLEVLYSMVGYIQKGVTLKQGQGVLNVLPLAGVKDDIDAQLVPLEDSAAGAPPRRAI